MPSPSQRRKRRRTATKGAARAWRALEDGDERLALKEMKRALSKARDNPALWVDYSQILTELGHLGEAEHVVRHALELAPTSAAGHTHLALVLSRKGLTIEAYRAQARAATLSPDVPLYRELLSAYEKLLPEDWRGESAEESG